MTFAASTRASRASRMAGHSAGAESVPLAPRGRNPLSELSRAALPETPGRIPVEPGTPAPDHVHQVLESSGDPIAAPVRTAMEYRFGRDFGNVRVHADERAAESTRALDAHAYAVGEHLVFNRDRYAPGTLSGRRLLMHELAHVAQGSHSQGSRGRLRIGSPDSWAERAADLALNPRISPAALGAELSAGAPLEPVLHRAVSTWGGDWNTTQYDEHDTGGNKDGLDIELHFKPGPPVDATMIGIVQKAVSKKAGAVALPNATVQSRAVPAGKPGEGSIIDQLDSFRNPLYATGAAKGANDKLWDTPTGAAWGQHGYHHTDAAGVVHEKDAVMKDNPRIIPNAANSEQVFEDTAMAITGTQTGANYGSVQWGWKTDAVGRFTKLPLTVLSQTVPTAGFKEAQAMWNKSKDSAGNDLIKFYTANEKFVQADNAPLVSNPADAAKSEIAKLAQNTRVEVIDYGVGQKFNLASPADKWVKITITDGPSVGKTGWVKSSQLDKAKVKAGPANAAP